MSLKSFYNTHIQSQISGYKNKKFNLPPISNLYTNNLDINYNDNIGKNQCDTAAITYFANLIDNFRNNHFEIIFTDGSFFPDTGHTYAACINLDKKIAYRTTLHNHSGIYAAELEALLQALFMIITNNWKAVIIFIDSKSLLYSLNNRNIKFFCKNSDFSEIHRMINFITNNLKIKICFHWVPSHVGIGGNEIVDCIAKTGFHAEFLINQNFTFSFPSLNYNINSWIFNSYCDSWPDINSDHYIQITIPLVPKTHPWFNLPRKNQIAICRLLTGRCLTRPLLNKFNPLININCPTCNVKDDINHIYNNCTKYIHQHKALKHICGDPNYSFPQILNTIFTNSTMFTKINRILYNIYLSHYNSLPIDS